MAPLAFPPPVGLLTVVSHWNPSALGMQVQIRTNSVEFEFAPNSHEFVYPLNSNSSLKFWKFSETT